MTEKRFNAAKLILNVSELHMLTLLGESTLDLCCNFSELFWTNKLESRLLHSVFLSVNLVCLLCYEHFVPFWLNLFQHKGKLRYFSNTTVGFISLNLLFSWYLLFLPKTSSLVSLSNNVSSFCFQVSVVSETLFPQLFKGIGKFSVSSN